MAIAIRMPRMMMTTRSSMSVKPSLLSRRVRSLFNICVAAPFQRSVNYRWRDRYRRASVPRTPPNEGSASLAARDASPRTSRGADLSAPLVRAVSPDPLRLGSDSTTCPLRAGPGDDVGAGAVLEERVAADGRLDAVRGRRRCRCAEGDVLDAGVVARLQLAERDADVAVVVGCVRLDTRNSRAHVRLRGRLVGAILEAEVGRDGDRHQDPEDDDDDEEFDEGEALVALDAPPQVVQHSRAPFEEEAVVGGSKPLSDRRRGAVSPRPSGSEIKVVRVPYGQAPRRMSAPGPFLKNV